VDRFPDVRPISTVAKNILNKRYFLENEKTWEELVERNIEYIVPKKYKNKNLVKQIILNRYFLPNSPCLANAGKEDAGLAACYVVDFPDTIDGIYETKYHFALIARKGGGCGTTLSKIRPKGSKVKGSTHGYAGGAIPFADTISHDMNVMTQGGLRSMAIMFTISVYHPDVLEFINAKEEEGKIANANMSVVVDDKFMEAVKNNEKYWTEFDGVRYKQYNAKDVFDMIVDGAWRNGEPALLFQNRIDDSAYKYSGQEILATNPCAEQPLPPNGVCNLGSIDLSKFVKNNKETDYDKLEIVIREGVRYLNFVAEKSVYPTDKIQKWVDENKAIGIGYMGWADYLLIKEIPYGSKESIDEIDTIGKFLNDISENESEKISGEMGIPKACENLPKPRRNVTVTTLAPTGTLSLLAGCSSGIEPIFSEITIRNDKTGTYTFENDLVSKPYFRCAVSSNGAKEVTWEEHVLMLAGWQKYIHSGVSKTINFPTHTHRETIGKAMFMAWENGTKGIAVYRNGSRKVEVLTPKNLKKEKCPQCGEDVIKVSNKMKCSSCDWIMKEE